MYELLVHDQITHFEERMEAVKAAKEITNNPDMHGLVDVTDGVETLQYRDGKLVAYTYETRRSNRRRVERRPDETEGQAEAVSADGAAEPAPPAKEPAAAADKSSQAEE